MLSGDPDPDGEWDNIVSRLPIHRFPVEILANIFHEVVVEDSYQPRIWEYINLCSVCHEWRDVVISQPKFWTALAIGTDDFGSDYDFDLVPHLQKWFGRAGVLPLKLQLEIRPKAATPLLHDFLISNTRWKELIFMIEGRLGGNWVDTLFQEAVEASDAMEAPCWESLDTLNVEMLDAEVDVPSLEIYTRLPNLRNLRLCVTTTQYWDYSPVLQSLHHLTRLTLNFYRAGASATFFLSVIEGCVNLEYFWVNCDDHGDKERDIDAAPITHRNLRHLVVWGIPCSMLLFLGHPILPVLTTLEVYDYDNTGVLEAQTELEGILELAKRSKCALTSLMWSSPAKGKQVDQLLLGLPTLTEITLNYKTHHVRDGQMCLPGQWSWSWMLR